jgi:hypothetical protein
MFPRVDLKVNKEMVLDYADEVSNARSHDCVPVESNFPLYVMFFFCFLFIIIFNICNAINITLIPKFLYTSGTTGTPKGVVRITGGKLKKFNYIKVLNILTKRPSNRS